MSIKVHTHTHVSVYRSAYTHTHTHTVKHSCFPCKPRSLLPGKLTLPATPGSPGHPELTPQPLGQMTATSQCCHSVWSPRIPAPPLPLCSWGRKIVSPGRRWRWGCPPHPATDRASITLPLKWAVSSAGLPCPDVGVPHKDRPSSAWSSPRP